MIIIFLITNFSIQCWYMGTQCKGIDAKVGLYMASLSLGLAYAMFALI